MDDVSEGHSIANGLTAVATNDGLHQRAIDDAADTAADQYMTPASDLFTISAVSPFNEDDTRAIIRQVEYYFSDQNLPTDAHLLGLAGGDPNEAISLNQILGFKRMRRFRPRLAIKAVLERSAVLELSQDRKKIKRRFPLQLDLLVAPRIDVRRDHVEKTLAANPHLTKGMLKPTGFEEYYADSPVTPQQYALDRELYHEESSFETRIENAVRMYRVKRKMHQYTLKVFDLWMSFGGVEMTGNAFTGGFDRSEEDELSKDEIAFLRCPYSVSELITVNDELFQVSFTKVALSFLSTEFPLYSRPEVSEDVTIACNVMVNFFNYLLHHDVCPEYSSDILEARQAVQEAKSELHQLSKADKALHNARGFQAACSILHELPKAQDDPWLEGREIKYTPIEARTIFQAGVVAFGTAEQVQELEARWSTYTNKTNTQEQLDMNTVKQIDEQTSISPASAEDNKTTNDKVTSQRRLLSAGWTLQDQTLLPPIPLHSPFVVVGCEELGLEISSLTPAAPETSAYFDALSDSKVLRMGTMHCHRWVIPGRDLDSLDSFGKPVPDEIDLIIEESVMQTCRVGMKLQCEVRQLDIGIYWLERIERTLPSFYDYMPNFKQINAYLQQLEQATANNGSNTAPPDLLSAAQGSALPTLVEPVS